MLSRPVYDVLLIDDNPLDCRRVDELLVTAGYRVAAVRDGAIALEWLRTHPAPSLIILDLMMLEMDGWRFRDEQLEDPQLADIAVVVQTVLGGQPPHAAQLKAAALLSKPVERDALLQIVTRFCR